MTIAYPLDLHMHSTFSDGLLMPRELCEKADKLHLTWIALCDHDTTDGLSAMESAVRQVNSEHSDAPLNFLPGIELSSGTDGRTHILGYGVSPAEPTLQAFLRTARQERMERAAEMFRRLAGQGIHLPEDEQAALLKIPAVGRAHIARALVRQGAVSGIREAFERYLLEGRCAYVPRPYVPSAHGVALLIRAGAVPVLAHPRRLSLEPTVFHSLIAELMAAGLQGLECYHPSATRPQAAQLAEYARRHGLLVTGGSDFHGDINTRVHMGHMPGGWSCPQQDIAALIKAAHRA